LACGTPVISTGSHLVENGSDGILLVSKDSKAVADSLNKLLNNRDMRTKLGEDGRRTIEQSFSWESISRNLVTVYEKMLLN
jgi:glycosyltransferase involved in cell wall biosynthesis